MAELSRARAGRRSTRTIAVESEDPALVAARRARARHLADRPNVCLARGLKTLVGFGAVRFAVIDVGTNSVKFHVGERRADDAWRTIVDRAEVTRLGEGLDETGGSQPEPIAADRGRDRRAWSTRRARPASPTIAAVGTAGLRIAANSARARRRGARALRASRSR